jgi:hypothetical protein
VSGEGGGPGGEYGQHGAQHVEARRIGRLARRVLDGAREDGAAAGRNILR